EQEVHKVQILDPATGTGTFLAEVIKHVHKKFEGQQGIWSNYVENHLIPRLNGFELLMASYAMAHLKLDLLLKETGFKPTKDQRFRVFLTNSLEEHHPDTGTLWANWLSSEANEANHIKRDTPVMCVIGNPPYFGFKSNEGEWITKLTNDYKFIDGENINEKKHRLGNDYVKFIRFGQYFIDKNQAGILTYINDHGFLFNPTFKGMRWNLMKSFDEIYILDLHGNSKKKEKSSDGSKDENVFDIQQGVSINIFIKTGRKKKNALARIFYYDLLGLREMKYEYLFNNNFKSVPYKEIFPDSPFYFFLPNKLSNVEGYESGFSVSKILNTGVTGTVTGNDELLIGADIEVLKSRLGQIVDSPVDNKYIKSIEYRPFDKKAMYFVETFNKNPYPKIVVPASYRSRYNVMKHLAKPNNFCLIVGRQGQVVGSMPWNIIFISDRIVDLNMFYRGGGVVSPLYLYPETNAQQTIGQTTERTPNLNAEIVKQIAEKLGLTFTNEKETAENTFAPIDILDYIYAVLHSPTYREKYKEFLKIDFPRVPYPKDKDTFWQLVKLGGEIRQIHLLESLTIEKYITQYPIDGNNVVSKPIYQNGKVYINDSQYFDNVPEIAWNFYIGGYQPAQKWLKDRKGRTLEFDDILHYQKIIVALSETDRLMK
ncbi:MAG: type ISP restriction/modification enzyme, partial [Flavobacteriaceae bacterium]|nr:type ISP restriction/modification enzyme [Flavobacteriaceae bacterium]